MTSTLASSSFTFNVVPFSQLRDEDPNNTQLRIGSSIGSIKSSFATLQTIVNQIGSTTVPDPITITGAGGTTVTQSGNDFTISSSTTSSFADPNAAYVLGEADPALPRSIVAVGEGSVVVSMASGSLVISGSVVAISAVGGTSVMENSGSTSFVLSSSIVQLDSTNSFINVVEDSGSRFTLSGNVVQVAGVGGTSVSVDQTGSYFTVSSSVGVHNISGLGLAQVSSSGSNYTINVPLQNAADANASYVLESSDAGLSNSWVLAATGSVYLLTGTNSYGNRSLILSASNTWLTGSGGTSVWLLFSGSTTVVSSSVFQVVSANTASIGVVADSGSRFTLSGNVPQITSNTQMVTVDNTHSYFTLSGSLYNFFGVGGVSVTTGSGGSTVYVSGSAQTVTNISGSGGIRVTNTGSDYVISGTLPTVQNIIGSNGTMATTTGTTVVISSAKPETGAEFILLAATGSLPNARTITAGTGITLTDSGAGSALTVSATGGGSITLSGDVDGLSNANYVNGIAGANAAFVWTKTTSSPELIQQGQTTDVATNAMTVQAQNAYTSAATNTTGGTLVLRGGYGKSNSQSAMLNLGGGTSIANGTTSQMYVDTIYFYNTSSAARFSINTNNNTVTIAPITTDTGGLGSAAAVWYQAFIQYLTLTGVSQYAVLYGGGTGSAVSGVLMGNNTFLCGSATAPFASTKVLYNDTTPSFYPVTNNNGNIGLSSNYWTNAYVTYYYASGFVDTPTLYITGIAANDIIIGGGAGVCTGLAVTNNAFVIGSAGAPTASTRWFWYDSTSTLLWEPTASAPTLTSTGGACNVYNNAQTGQLYHYNPYGPITTALGSVPSAQSTFATPIQQQQWLNRQWTGSNTSFSSTALLTVTAPTSNTVIAFEIHYIGRSGASAPISGVSYINASYYSSVWTINPASNDIPCGGNEYLPPVFSLVSSSNTITLYMAGCYNAMGGATSADWQIMINYSIM